MAAAAAASILSAPLIVSAQQAVQDGGREPLGLRGGNFLFLPSLTVRGGYTDNIDRTAANPEAGSVAVIAPALAVRSDWTRHALNLDLNAQYAVYDGDFDRPRGYFDALAVARLDIYSASAVTVQAGYGRIDNGGSTDHRASAGADLTHRFNRLAVTLRGGAERFNFDDSRAGLTSTVDTNVSDYSQYSAGLGASYDLSSLTSVFAEADFNRRDHRRRIDANGFQRGSEGYAAAAGVRMSNGSKLSGRFSAGYRMQKPDDPALARIHGVTVDAGLAWQASPLTRVALEAGTRFGETTLAGSAGYISRSAGFNIEHRFGRKLVLNSGFTYTRDNFVGVGLVEQTYDAGVGLDYFLNRNMVLSADAQHLRFVSTTAGEDYDANTVTLGVTVRR